jgi:UDP-GlcNAc3NAcA epimerase
MMEELENYILLEKPDAVLVYGDTNTTMAGALVAAKCNIPVIHVEAGLRSYLRTMPEEINRIVTDHVSTLLFSPTQQGVDNLQQEGMPMRPGPYGAANPGIFQCGDVMYDNAVFYGNRNHLNADVEKWKDENFVLTTIHRDHNTDDPQVLLGIIETMEELTARHQLKWVLPVHPRLKKNLESHEEIQKLLSNATHVHLISPLGYVSMLQMENLAKMIVTDSGGVQKEAYFAKKPCLILRDTTEWKEIIETGNAFLVGAHPEKIKEKFQYVIAHSFDHWPTLYGEGNAAEEIAKVICEYLA